MPAIVAALADMAVNAGIVAGAVLSARVLLFTTRFLREVIDGWHTK